MEAVNDAKNESDLKDKAQLESEFLRMKLEDK